ncbi:hypothetical protein EJ357_28815 [Streptomyces cyaneochromogenes]|uniref:VCBS repeat-containing protein n=1 Tax=Streptomyces cyaneochromogenes TaxID=2496836 RepID=A0A3Q9EWC9_9ACTN|nr:FG-GAP-like repeat-containing protein [Streptomyces cyaneochromogenes]AZQ36957.1 hypothetical protein EJ357_28815 [Streptomyces cyaneochromogenes]
MTRTLISGAGAVLVSGLLTAAAVVPAAAAPTEQSAPAAAPQSADFNGDGYTDLVAGLPQAGPGSVTVVPGGPDGPEAAAKLSLTRPGGGQDGDLFGASSAWGDVDGDGHADLVVGAPGVDDAEGRTDTGEVTVLYGPSLDRATTLTVPAANRVGGERLGTDVAVADFNADGKADVLSVALGRPAHWWLFDGATGATRSWEFGRWDDENVPRDNSLVVGDFNADGFPDAAADYLDASGSGRIATFKGSATGLERVGGFSDAGTGSAATGDVNGDGFADLVVGAPDSPYFGVVGGNVRVILGSVDGLTVDGAHTVDQNTAGVPGADESGDRMGASVTVADVDRDGFADVLTGLPGEDLTATDGPALSDAGATLLLKGSATGLTGEGARALTQNTTGVTGTAEAADRFGSAVTLADLDADGRTDAAIGVEGENADDGTILQLDGNGTGLVATSGVYYGRPALGTPAGARLGQSLTP